MSEAQLLIRLYLDADVDVKLAASLRGAGYDCVSAREVDNAALDDESQMVFAANEGRVLLTHNIQDFVPLFEQWWHAGLNHPGIVVSQQIPFSELRRRVVHLLDNVTADEMKNNLRNLAEFAERP
jgi:predicted nuclease of predicted toxin-antitoxin system